MLVYAFLIGAAMIFALQAIRSRRLIVSALWLAGTSALLSLTFYLLGAQLVAVIELSVGAGLVTVLFVFAISISGEDSTELRAIVPNILSGTLVLVCAFLLGWLSLPVSNEVQTVAEPALSQMIWETRGLDVLVQVVLIFAGVLGLLGLLAETRAPLEHSAADEFFATRDLQLDAMEELAKQEQP
jgi:NADH:ubiquinone oxidoreductase subunit 6 (subunit J)